jgi:breast cancer 2 susceptibility protein
MSTFRRPPEIILVNPSTAPYYRFSYLDIMRGPQDVMEEFRAEGLGHVGIEWFENHWRMIVWKLASMVRAKPELFQQKWTYREVVRQMKYRYV